MDGARAVWHVQGALHVTQIAAELFRGDRVIVYVELEGGESDVCLTVFDLLQYRLCRYGSPLVLIGLRFFDYEAYFDEIQLPLTDPDGSRPVKWCKLDSSVQVGDYRSGTPSSSLVPSCSSLR